MAKSMVQDEIVNRSRHPFFMMDNAMVDSGAIAEIGAQAFTVYAVMLRYAGQRDVCFPAIKTIIEKTSLSESTVRRCIRGLVEAGLLTVTPRFNDDGSNTSNLYEIYPCHERAKKQVDTCQAVCETGEGVTQTGEGVTQTPLLKRNTLKRNSDKEDTIPAPQGASSEADQPSATTVPKSGMDLIPHTPIVPAPPVQPKGTRWGNLLTAMLEAADIRKKWAGYEYIQMKKWLDENPDVTDQEVIEDFVRYAPKRTNLALQFFLNDFFVRQKQRTRHSVQGIVEDNYRFLQKNL